MYAFLHIYHAYFITNYYTRNHRRNTSATQATGTRRKATTTKRRKDEVEFSYIG